jgi:basic amino acid/polyamine antiporter, APA family
MVTSGDGRPTAPRVLNTFDAGCIVIGAIIGVGIFFTPSRMAGLVGGDGLLLLAWGLAGLIALCGALTFAELGARRHGTGAQYQVLRDAYGPMTGFLFVFCNATAVQAGAIGVIALVCVEYLAKAAGVALEAPWGMVLACLLIAGLSGANILGVRWGARVQNATVVCKVATLAAIFALAVWKGSPAAAAPGVPAAPAPGSVVGGVLAALVPALFAFGGWQQALWISGEVKEPSRTLPRAIVGGVVIVIVVYMLANWSYLRLLGGWEGVAGSKALAADAAQAAVGGWGSRVLAAAVGVSAFGAVNAQFLSGPRLIFGLAQDGRFFPAFGRLSPGLGTPAAAITLLAGVALVLLVSAGAKGLDLLLTGVVFVDSVFFILTGAAVFVLRRRDAARPAFLSPLYPLVPAVFILGEVGVAIGAHLDRGVLLATLIGVGWIAGASVLYVWRFGRPTARPGT